jgi:hypothetical protein
VERKRLPKRRPDASFLSIDIAKEKRRLAVLLPDVDPADLDLILHSLARPFGSGRRFFLRAIRPGVRVF